MEAGWFKLMRVRRRVFQAAIVVCFSFSRRDVAEGFHQSMMIEPGHPFQRCQLDGLPCFPSAAMNQFGLVQTVDCLGQCVVVTVATATNRGLDACFVQSL